MHPENKKDRSLLSVKEVHEKYFDSLICSWSEHKIIRLWFVDIPEEIENAVKEGQVYFHIEAGWNEPNKDLKLDHDTWEVG